MAESVPVSSSPPRLPEHLPLSAPVLAILLALSSGELHGYAVMKQAALPSCGAVSMGPGTLYGSLDRMQRDHLVEETGLTDDVRRRYYRITAQGQRSLAAEIDRLSAVLSRQSRPASGSRSREKASRA